MGTRKKVVPFKEEEAYVMEVAGAGVKVGQKVATESSRQILVATTWRSGSTFLGDLLNHNPGVFYYFEPLHYYSQMTKEEKAENQEPEGPDGEVGLPADSQRGGAGHAGPAPR